MFRGAEVRKGREATVTVREQELDDRVDRSRNS